MSKKDENILGKPKIDQIRARISVLEKHFSKSGNQLGLDAKLGNTTVDGWTDNQIGKPSLAVKEFLKHYNIREEWWKTGEGDVFNKNGTSVHIPKENNGNSMTPRETFYTDLIENNAEYSLLPRAVLQDYKIVPDKIIDVIIASTASEKKALEDSKRMEIEGLNQKYELIIAGLENKCERLEKENEDLRRQIPAQSKK